MSSDGQPSHIPQAKQHAFVDFEDEYTALRKTLEELNASLDDHQPHAHHQPASQDPLHSDVISQEPPGHAHTDSQVANAHLDDKDWYKQDATVFRDSIQEHFNTRADLQQEPSYADSHRSNASRRHNDRKQSTAAPSVLGSISQRNLPVLNNSFIVPAQATKPKKVDRVNRHK